GSERWGHKMRARISEILGADLYDIYGLTEIYGPGIGINCKPDSPMHIWSDYVYTEVINPKTGKIVKDGEVGELVFTTLQKEGAPLIRFRTHDLSRIVPGKCSCGSKHPRIDVILGRTDDMVKIKGVNIFPAQIEEVIKFTDGASSEYQVMIDHMNGRDQFTIFFETEATGDELKAVQKSLGEIFKAKIGVTPIPKGVPIGYLPRSEKKTQRIYDNRY
ncbi:MAG: hypothetical protein MJ189_02485, partial [Coriobacteriales bacterium]|nr:hypothetical protein [Coriobacteriales bacterium]